MHHDQARPVTVCQFADVRQRAAERVVLVELITAPSTTPPVVVFVSAGGRLAAAWPAMRREDADVVGWDRLTAIVVVGLSSSASVLSRRLELRPTGS